MSFASLFSFYNIVQIGSNHVIQILIGINDAIRMIIIYTFMEMDLYIISDRVI